MALFIGTAIIVVLLITLINGVLIRGFLAGASRVFQPQNTTTRAGDHPTAGTRTVRQPNVFRAMGHTGLPGSQLRGHRPGRRRARPGSTARPAKEPIRVYAGLQTADTDEQRMAVVLSELERTGAFDRKLLVDHPHHRHRLDQPGGRAGRWR